MHRSDFEMIAATLRGTYAPPSQIEAFADFLATTNDRFDRARFVTAALPEGGVGDGHVAVRMTTGNAAFRDEFEMVEWTVVREAISEVMRGALRSRPILDPNGNTVGRVESF